jgi:hypothetical protein
LLDKANWMSVKTVVRSGGMIPFILLSDKSSIWSSSSPLKVDQGRVSGILFRHKNNCRKLLRWLMSDWNVISKRFPERSRFCKFESNHTESTPDTLVLLANVKDFKEDSARSSSGKVPRSLFSSRNHRKQATNTEWEDLNVMESIF